MFESQIENLKELVSELEEELENGNNSEAIATIYFINASCESLSAQLDEMLLE